MTAADLDLEALREVVAKGTPGPDWQTFPSDAAGPGWGIYMPAVKQARAFIQNQEDAELIVAAVNALPALLDALEEARLGHTFMSEQFATMQREKEHGWREAEKWEVRAGNANAEVERLRRTCEEWQKVNAKAESEVARLTAVVQGVRELADLWQAKAESLRQRMTEREDDGEDHVRRVVAYATDGAANELREVLAGGTDTPKGELE